MICVQHLTSTIEEFLPSWYWSNHDVVSITWYAVPTLHELLIKLNDEHNQRLYASRTCVYLMVLMYMHTITLLKEISVVSTYSIMGNI